MNNRQGDAASRKKETPAWEKGEGGKKPALAGAPKGILIQGEKRGGELGENHGKSQRTERFEKKGVE